MVTRDRVSIHCLSCSEKCSAAQVIGTASPVHESPDSQNVRYSVGSSSEELLLHVCSVSHGQAFPQGRQLGVDIVLFFRGDDNVFLNAAWFAIDHAPTLPACLFGLEPLFSKHSNHFLRLSRPFRSRSVQPSVTVGPRQLRICLLRFFPSNFPIFLHVLANIFVRFSSPPIPSLLSLLLPPDSAHVVRSYAAHAPWSVSRGLQDRADLAMGSFPPWRLLVSFVVSNPNETKIERKFHRWKRKAIRTVLSETKEERTKDLESIEGVSSLQRMEANRDPRGQGGKNDFEWMEEGQANCVLCTKATSEASHARVRASIARTDSDPSTTAT